MPNKLLLGVNISLLFDFYGELLTERQRELLDLYYGEDLSLSEISQMTGITRQGVRAGILKAETILRRTEEKLGLLARFGSSKETVSEIVRVLTAVKEGDPPCEEVLTRLIEKAKALL